MPALATWAPEDGVLGAVAPLALAASQPICLVVDLDQAGPAYPGSRTLRDLVEGGLRAADLSPQRRGTAILANGNVSAADAAEVLGHLIAAWPAIVLRTAAVGQDDVPAPLVPVRLLVPGGLFSPSGRGVYQLTRQSFLRPRPPQDAVVVLPPAPRAVLRHLLRGRQPGRSRWIKSWRRVWATPW